MLDADTKRRIDTCRDILVGKVPDPKSQVEQITIALIYKFMDDMDAEAEELGGERSFFAGDYAKYGWAKLMAPNMGGFDVLALYSEAIQKMNENPGIPALFRDIFKNAYLPYRDPETLRSFLKEIDGFSYDHSERLGDAFEYLLSVLGSQGDAGQFRTPRHIIDFMVDVINPQKNESVLDPACGTAGFLISAWKLILKQNTKERPGDQLTPEERANLAANIHGYDISPDMVRLSLVNLYLHGFTDPHIIEYDTLTSEERWNETADVILANPPFMSPKGGIKPHKRFSVQATRSEVLFVDYIAEHLSPQGRAAIVVPEGIIFQSGTAYKQLREMLVKTSLVAVVSLPAGVFNPYSGVKTSILILDKRLAKSCDSVLFVKIGNDGYGLGAQRRAVAGSDLPEAVRVLSDWMRGQFDEKTALATRVERVRIGEGGEWNLSGERYIEAGFEHAHFPVPTIGEICEINPKKSQLSDLPAETVVSFVPMKDLAENNIDFRPQEQRLLGDMLSGAYTYFRNGDVLIAKVTPCFENGKAGVARNLQNSIGFGSSEYYILRPSEAILPELLYYFLSSPRFKEYAIPAMTGTGGLQRVPRSTLESFRIPLPPLPIQQEIVAEIESYQKIIDGARQVVENYRPRINVQPDWPRIALGELTTTGSGGTPSKQVPEFWAGDIPWVSPKDMKQDFLVDTEDHISQDAVAQSATKLLPAGVLLCVVRSGILQHSFPVSLTTRPMAFNQDILAIQSNNEKLDIRYLFYIFKSKCNEILAEGIKPGVTVQSFHNGFFKAYQLPLPDIETQRSIVAEIEAEQALVNANKQLIERFEAKIKATINRVWGG